MTFIGIFFWTSFLGWWMLQLMLVLRPGQPAADYDQDREGDLVEVHVEGGNLRRLPAYHGTFDYAWIGF